MVCTTVRETTKRQRERRGDNVEERPEKDEQRRAAEVVREIQKRGVIKIKNGVIVPADQAKKRPHIVNIGDIEEESIRWLYYPYFPMGKVTLMAAYPGSGKTYLMCHVSACVSNGSPLFNDIPFRREPGIVLYLSTEDGIGDTLRPRMRACGANLDNIKTVIDEDAVLTFDSPYIEELVKEVRPDLMIFDPFQSYIGEDVEMNAANKTRAKLNNIVRIAQEYDVAIVLICHFNKNQKGDAITRIIGSTDIVGVCRSYLALGTVPDNRNLRYMSHEKSSLSPRGRTVLFEINPEEGGIKFIDYTDMTMDDYAALTSKNRRRVAPVLEEAKGFILRNMPDGKRSAKDMKELMKANGFSDATINRARESLGIKSQRVKYQGSYTWVLPNDSRDIS